MARDSNPLGRHAPDRLAGLRQVHRERNDPAPMSVLRPRCGPPKQMTNPNKPSRVLVVFNTVCLYGMERSVIETFALLQPEVQPIFLMNRANVRHRTPLWLEMQRSSLPF